jgi:glycosidase
MPVLYYGDEVGLPGAGVPDNRRDMPWTGLTTDQTALAARLARLAGVRAAHPALRRGTWSLISSTADTIAWRMSLDADTVYVLVNRSDVAQSVGGLPAVPLRDELDGSALSGPAVEVAPRSARFLAPGA